MQWANTQFSLKAGLEHFGDQGKEAAVKELTQLHQCKAFQPININNLTHADHQTALESLIFLKEKRDGRIKGRACADGRKQRKNTPKEEAMSPTVALEMVLLTTVSEAHEGHDVAIIDIPNAFIQTDMEGDTIIMKSCGQLAKLLVQTDPKLC